MGFCDDADTAIGGVGQHLRQCRLRAWVKVEFWLFQVDELIGFGCVQSHQNWQGLRHPETDISNADQIAHGVSAGA